MLGSDDEVLAIPAASVIVIRDAPFEILMMRRHERSSVAANAWVFPGGVAEQIDNELAHEIGDGSMLASLRLTGLRETFEETGVWLGSELTDAEHKRRRLLAGSLTLRHLLAEANTELASLVWTSRWITPIGLPKRFDTYFFLAKVARDVVASPAEDEAADVTWIHPREALASHADGTMQMVFPTLRNLEAIRDFDSADALLASRRGVAIEPVQPILVNGKPTLR